MPNTPQFDGNLITGALWNANIADQVISTVTSGTRPAGTEGQVIYETDTDRLYIYIGGWINFGMGSAFIAWTPTLTQSGTVTATVTTGSYWKYGRLVVFHTRLAVTGSGTANNPVICGAPVTPASATSMWGTGMVRDASASALVVGHLTTSGGTSNLSLHDATVSTNNLMLGQTGAAFALGLANGDTVEFSGAFESAA